MDTASRVYPVAGSILFYGSVGTPLDRAIAWWTRSRFVHVAIQVSATAKIEAEGVGIVKTPVVGRAIAASWSPHVAASFDPARLSAALVWVEGMVGKPYGTSDLLTAIEEGLPWHTFYTIAFQHYDCSALATQFLILAGATDVLGALALDPHAVTPAMLAKQLGVT